MLTRQEEAAKRSCFNSIKVRLKLTGLTKAINGGMKFQFHKGAIKTLGNVTDMGLCFVSIP